jgi:hypothetical protein
VLKWDRIILLNFQAFLRLFVGFLPKKMMTLFVFALTANTLETSPQELGRLRQIENLQRASKNYGMKLQRCGPYLGIMFERIAGIVGMSAQIISQNEQCGVNDQNHLRSGNQVKTDSIVA